MTALDILVIEGRVLSKETYHEAPLVHRSSWDFMAKDANSHDFWPFLMASAREAAGPWHLDGPGAWRPSSAHVLDVRGHLSWR